LQWLIPRVESGCIRRAGASLQAADREREAEREIDADREALLD
jgi:hypothetical protein